MFEEKFNFKLSKLMILAIVLLMSGLILSGCGWWQLVKYSRELPAHPCSILAASSSGMLADIYIDVSGAVKDPGIYQLQTNSRVAEAIDLAGGFSNQASKDFISTQLNLAAKLHDEEKIHILTDAEWQAQKQLSTSSNIQTGDWVEAGSGLLSINSATQSELETLKGIGEKRATDIIENRPFSTLDELVSREVITQTIFDNIKNSIKL